MKIIFRFEVILPLINIGVIAAGIVARGAYVWG